MKKLKILICGLSGAGKTYFATKLTSILSPHYSVLHLNADAVRTKFNDWDFSESGRIRQSLRMKKLSDDSNSQIIIMDFIAPKPVHREAVAADCTVFIDHSMSCIYENTVAIFEPPTCPDFVLSNREDHEKVIEEVVQFAKLHLT